MVTWTQTDIDALKKNIGLGVLSTSMGDRSVTFNSLKEMRDLLAEMERSVAGTPGYRLGTTSKGV